MFHAGEGDWGRGSMVQPSSCPIHGCYRIAVENIKNHVVLVAICRVSGSHEGRCLKGTHLPQHGPLEEEHDRREQQARVRVVDECQPPRVVQHVRQRLSASVGNKSRTITRTISGTISRTITVRRQQREDNSTRIQHEDDSTRTTAQG